MASGSQMLGTLGGLQGRGAKRRSWSASFPQLRPWDQRWMSRQDQWWFVGKAASGLDRRAQTVCLMWSSKDNLPVTWP